MMSRRVFSVLLIAIFLFLTVPFSFAENTNAEFTDEELAQFISGTYKGFTYYYDAKTGRLIIRGSGKMPSFENEKAPWAQFADKATQVVISSGITSISEKAFEGFKKLKTITIPETVTEIAATSFTECEAIEKVEFTGEPEVFQKLIEESEIEALVEVVIEKIEEEELEEQIVAVEEAYEEQQAAADASPAPSPSVSPEPSPTVSPEASPLVEQPKAPAGQNDGDGGDTGDEGGAGETEATTEPTPTPVPVKNGDEVSEEDINEHTLKRTTTTYSDGKVVKVKVETVEHGSAGENVVKTEETTYDDQGGESTVVTEKSKPVVDANGDWLGYLETVTTDGVQTSNMYKDMDGNPLNGEYESTYSRLKNRQKTMMVSTFVDGDKTSETRKTYYYSDDAGKVLYGYKMDGQYYDKDGNLSSESNFTGYGVGSSQNMNH